MTIQIRAAVAQDITGLLAVKSAVWPDEAVTNPEYAVRVIAEPAHVTLVAEVDGAIAAFVDGFLTLAADGRRRWEVDLLAVHPDYRQRGLARQLIVAHTHAGFTMGADAARALIKSDNHASQHAFAACGYTCDDQPYGLYVAGEGDSAALETPAGLYLIPVMTLNYRGLWVEGAWGIEAFRYALGVRSRQPSAVAGAVLPVHQQEAAAALSAGFTLTGIYHWWRLTADAEPIPR